MYVNEMWLYVVRNREEGCMFPGEVKVGSINIQYKNHIPKMIFISAV